MEKKLQVRVGETPSRKKCKKLQVQETELEKLQVRETPTPSAKNSKWEKLQVVSLPFRTVITLFEQEGVCGFLAVCRSQLID